MTIRTQQESTRRAGAVLWGIYVLAALIAVFLVPYYVPGGSPSVSDSYVFGYNNKAGIALVLMFTAILAVCTNGIGLKFCAIEPSKNISYRTLLYCLSGALALCLGMYFFTGRFGGFGESFWLIDKVKLIDEGKMPYRDFEYVLGPLFLYGPALLKWALHMSVSNAYYLFWTANALLGIFLLFQVINMIEYPSDHKQAIFVLFYLCYLSELISTGLNYTLCRYVPAAFFALMVHKVFAGEHSARRQMAAFFLTSIFTGCLFLISPEMGISYAIGSAVFFGVYGNLKNLGGVLSYLGMLILLAGVSFAADALGTFQALKAYSGGAFNFPIIPAAHILMFFFSLALAASYVAVRFRQRAPADNSILLIAVFCPALAAALGRCDPGHVAFNALGILLAGAFYVSGFRRGWVWYKWCFLGIFAIAPFFTELWLYRSLLTRAVVIDLVNMDGNVAARADMLIEKTLARRYGDAAVNTKIEKLKQMGRRGDAAVDIPGLYPQATKIINVPFGYFPNGGGFGTYHSSSLDEGRYIGLFNVSSPVQTTSKIEELTRHGERDLLLPESFKQLCVVDPEASRSLISVLFLYPYRKRAVHLQSVTQPLCDFIVGHYRLSVPPSADRFGYELWKPEVR